MYKPSIHTLALLVAAALAWPGVSSAQSFKVAKYSIGGDGGTDYLTAEPGTGRVFVSRSTHVMVIDGNTGKVIGDIPDTPRTHGIALAPKSGHGFIAYDRATDRIFAGCGKTSVVLDAKTGKVAATITNGDGVDALGWDPAQKLIYIPAGRDSNVTVVRQDSPDKYTVVATVPTMRGAKTISVDVQKHIAYLFQPEYGPPPAGTPPPQPGQRPVRGPVIGAYFFAISH